MVESYLQLGHATTTAKKIKELRLYADYQAVLHNS